MRVLSTLLGLLIALWGSVSVFAQKSEKKPAKDTTIVTMVPQSRSDYKQVNTSLAPQVYSGLDVTTDRTFRLSTYILLFGLLLIIMVCVLAFRIKFGADNLMKLITVILISISSLFLVVAGYSTVQIAPAFGLLGTLAGYLLGKNSSAKADHNE